MTNEVIQGNEWTAYGVLGRLTKTKRGIIFQARA